MTEWKVTTTFVSAHLPRRVLYVFVIISDYVLSQKAPFQAISYIQRLTDMLWKICYQVVQLRVGLMQHLKCFGRHTGDE